MQPDPQPNLSVEVPLLRAVVGYRLVAAVWLAVLGGLILSDAGESERPGVVAATIAVVAIWTATATVIAVRYPQRLGAPWFIAIDIVISIGSVWVADLAETTFVFAGGYPLAAVFTSLYTRGTFTGMFAAGMLSLTALIRLGTVTDVTAAEASLVIVYLFIGGAAAWTFSIIRRADANRIAAEEALIEERTERARAEERTELASRIHDSVLQTLALIQRDGDDSRRVRHLARQQERELRTWLFGDGSRTDGGFQQALRGACAEVEEMTHVRASLVNVGSERVCDEAADALVKASREALLNAAKHAGVDEVSVYAETHEMGATVFVRDRGCGFDPRSVPSDRRGISDSIVGRVSAVGGSAEIRSDSAGTEIRLDVPWSSETP